MCGPNPEKADGILLKSSSKCVACTNGTVRLRRANIVVLNYQAHIVCVGRLCARVSDERSEWGRGVCCIHMTKYRRGGRRRTRVCVDTGVLTERV